MVRLPNATAVDGWSLRLLLVGVLLLLPTLLMPLGIDQATYFRGGREMLSGGLLYEDFIDVKPPLLYLLVGGGGMLFGGTPISIRIFDLLWQGATILVLIMLFRQMHVDRLTTTCTVIVYAMLYVTLGYSQALQAETFVALPLLCILMLVHQRSTWPRDVGIGCCIGIAFLLKYPLAIIGPTVVLLFLLRGDDWRSVVNSTFRMSIGCAVLVAIVIWPLLADSRFAAAFSEIVAYLQVYTGSAEWNLNLLTHGLKQTGMFFGDNVSLLLCAAFAIGLLQKGSKFTWATGLFGLLLSLSIVIEHKFLPYQFARLYIPLSVIAGFGLALTVRHVQTLWQNRTLLSGAVLSGFVLLFLLFSPIPRYGNLVLISVRALTEPTAYDAYLTRPDVPGSDYRSVRALDRYLQQRLSASSRVLIISIMATPIVPFLPTKNVGPFADAHFYHGIGARDVWKQRAADFMSRANLVVIDTNDVFTGMTLHSMSSWQAIQRNPAFMENLASNFHRTDTVGCFFIYNRFE